MNKIILASSSPRRKELLEREGIDFIVDASSIVEEFHDDLSIEDKLCHLAYDKALPIHMKYPDDIVIGADTIVYAHGKIIGKPKDQEEAKNILLSLSNDCHEVMSAVAIYKEGQWHTFCEKTKVHFKDIRLMIDDYLQQDEWIDKAGGYAIQGIGRQFVDHIEGDFDNVVGLPVKRVKEYLVSDRF